LIPTIILLPYYNHQNHGVFFNEQFKNHVFVGINVNSTKTQRYPGEDNNIKKKNGSLRMYLAQDCLKKKRIIQRYREIMEI